jgi:hypothetical protein
MKVGGRAFSGETGEDIARTSLYPIVNQEQSCSRHRRVFSTKHSEGRGRGWW